MEADLLIGELLAGIIIFLMVSLIIIAAGLSLKTHLLRGSRESHALVNTIEPSTTHSNNDQYRILPITYFEDSKECLRPRNNPWYFSRASQLEYGFQQNGCLNYLEY